MDIMYTDITLLNPLYVRNRYFINYQIKILLYVFTLKSSYTVSIQVLQYHIYPSLLNTNI